VSLGMYLTQALADRAAAHACAYLAAVRERGGSPLTLDSRLLTLDS
jgi:hypothetical protein